MHYSTPTPLRDSNGVPNTIYYVYFLRLTRSGLIKIGTSSDVTMRMEALKLKYKTPLEFLGCMEGHFKKEREIHKQFKDLRQQGELFLPDDRLMEFIKLNTNPIYPPEEWRANAPLVKFVDGYIKPDSPLYDAIWELLPPIPETATKRGIIIHATYEISRDDAKRLQQLG